jgi:heme exporter protein B
MSPRLLIERDLRLALRRRSQWGLPLVFFAAAAGLFPLGVGPEPALLRQIAPGVLWVLALLAMVLSVSQYLAEDHSDGTLEQMVLGTRATWVLMASRALAHWLLHGLPLVLLSPLAGLMFGLQPVAVGVLALSLAAGTATLSLLGLVGAALTLGLRSGEALVFVLVLPLAVPALVFGTLAVSAAQAAGSLAGAQAHLSLLGAFLILTALMAPPAAAAALRISLA